MRVAGKKPSNSNSLFINLDQTLCIIVFFYSGTYGAARLAQISAFANGKHFPDYSAIETFPPGFPFMARGEREGESN